MTNGEATYSGGRQTSGMKGFAVIAGRNSGEFRYAHSSFWFRHSSLLQLTH
jgi:hypothetical protein